MKNHPTRARTSKVVLRKLASAGNLDGMTTSHSSLMFAPHPRARTALVAAVVVAITASLTACSTDSDDEPTSAASQPVDIAEEGTDGEGAEQAPDAGGYSSDDVGNATLRVNGNEFSDFGGDCSISRDSGRADVGDPNDGDIQLIIGVDNVAAQEDQDEMFMNYTAISQERFRFGDVAGASGVDTPASGEIITFTELGPRTADGSRDIVQIRVSGAVEDGTALEVDIVCELQNAF